MNVSIVGTASAKLAGETGKLSAVVRGVSTLDAARLAARNATIGAEGSATVDANVTNSVRVDARVRQRSASPARPPAPSR